ncbi:MAG: glucosylceramidase [Sphingobacteriales bacterium 50-39]|nr:glucosylceramidase [Sphingobacteriales bacterium]OJW56131.1 MAG: glucosylceramidase [Sphingobacteriales bacterium 50-39]
MRAFVKILPAFVFSTVILYSCSKKGDSSTPVTPPPPVQNGPDIGFYLTKADGSVLFQQQASLTFKTASPTGPIITVDSTKTYQTIDGFGYCLTGGSATLINHMSAGDRQSLLSELFGTDGAHLGVSYLRVSIGASDLSDRVFSYDDSGTAANPDTNLVHFDLGEDKTDLIPVLQQILTLAPNIKILASPWSAPVWMKDNDTSVAGTLQPQYYKVYAQYFVKYIQAMKALGITIDAITPQNEPQNPYNNPSMVLSSAQEADFIKNSLGPALQTAGLSTKIICWDHNCDQYSYPEDILKDAAAAAFVDGSAFHLYAGDISALSTVHNDYPNKNIYFTEQYVGGPSNFGGDFDWHVRNLIIGASRNWSRNVLEWNLAADPNYNPHTPGGCSNCLGALTIASTGTLVSRNTAYYIIAHASKFVRPGSLRIDSNVPGTMRNVAFLTPDGKKVLIAMNDSGSPQTFNIAYKSWYVQLALGAGDVGTFVW